MDNEELEFMILDPIKLALGEYTKKNTNQFQMEYMAQWVNTHDDHVCAAFRDYESIPDRYKTSWEAVRIATHYGTTAREMFKHRVCLEGNRRVH